jgi:hypothetical protein
MQRAIPMLVFLPNLLQHYFKAYVSGTFLGVMMESNPEAVIFKQAIPGSGSLVHCILGVAVFAIELYTCSAANISYFFVYYLMAICRFRGHNRVDRANDRMSG